MPVPSVGINLVERTTITSGGAGLEEVAPCGKQGGWVSAGKGKHGRRGSKYLKQLRVDMQ